MDDGRIAILAMAVRTGSVTTPEGLWSGLLAGREMVRDYSVSELQRGGVSADEYGHAAYVRRGNFLADADSFDADAFGYTARQAQRIDPQQRIFVELGHEALERAGYGVGTFAGAIGVYAGSRPRTWPLEPPDGESVATRAAHRLDCRGPAVAVRTFCSGSLVAVHLARQQLLGGECDMALVGGVALHFPQHVGYLYREGGTLSRTGRCRAFDAGADGLIFADGAVAIVLRRYADAVADRDPIVGVIRGSAINNDGARRAGYAAPSPAGQAQVVADAMADAEVEPPDIGLVEAHGAGTPLGDAVEFRALSNVWGRLSSGHCGLGSIKTNLGHADCVSGMMGLLKVTMAAKHGALPPSLNFEAPNPEIDLLTSPFHVVREAEPWPCPGRIAGVSSLGIGGTNAHVIVEAPPEQVTAPTVPGAWHALPLSARSSEQLRTLASDLDRFFAETPDTELADVAFTLQRGRTTLPHRRCVFARTAAEARAALHRAEAAAEPPSPSVATAAQDWQDGVRGAWSGLYQGEKRRRIQLPTYPFERERYGVERRPS